MAKEIRVVELFAGVGGFRLGLERWGRSRRKRFMTVWANQWEPNKRKQYAFDCYVKHFGNDDSHVNEDIAKAKGLIPGHDLLVGGFPCQDYSVARTQARGIEGHKGVLWWEIRDILRDQRPPYVLLENVDRLLKSPAKRRGRDFGVMLRCFADLGYAVEWRVINAAEYGFAQRRRRVFIFAFSESTRIHARLMALHKRQKEDGLKRWIHKDGFFAPEFPVVSDITPQRLFSATDLCEPPYVDLVDVSNHFTERFENSGVMLHGTIYSEACLAVPMPATPLRAVLEQQPVDERYFINGSLQKWEYLKGPKSEPRVRPNGEPYFYEEGAIPFPDPLDRPARTMLTSEAKLNRSTHVVSDPHSKRLRLLTPAECEQLNGFPIGWTDTGMPESFRYFMMGNALVVPLVEKMGHRLLSIIR